ncbi:hypothetical protein DESUT3_18760 [Desulfuromonas versatilis]|uniref:Uncharacterized protein n=1 Tax=Desulfuromonas versatilis TaxID=2802975 RepID=A0ABN6DY60_9BACT|nr:hypothetical protein [Desulfuromonas versatilis]BCR04807.1 hypothetical protein DESUT3_18760 [Desulfuromonas versatilis]
MTATTNSYPGVPEFAQENFAIDNLQDEIRVDRLCSDFLRTFYLNQVERCGLGPEQASALAYGADYFLREFIIPDRRENIFQLAPGRVRQFAGNWYIVKTLEPNMKELQGILEGVRAFYEYCQSSGKVSAELLTEIGRDCADLDFYAARIESFWAIEGDGFQSWNRACGIEG